SPAPRAASPAAPPAPVPPPQEVDLDWSDVDLTEDLQPAAALPGLETVRGAPETPLDRVDFGDALQPIELPDAPEELELAPASEFVPPPATGHSPRPSAAPLAFEPLEAAPAVLPPVLEVAPPPPAAGRSAAPGAEELLLREALSRASREVIERIAWEVVPQLAETIIREQLDRLVKERQR
ncbi:MAG TPA: response regulator, partial [Anaeromyxobacteraceae bacterium]